MEEFFHRPGFLGTRANLAADTTLILLLLFAVMITLGFALARRRWYEAHRWVQTSAVALNAVLVLWMMVLPYRDFIIRDQGGPRPAAFYLITHLHALAGAVALPFGVYVALVGNKLLPESFRFQNFKPYMRTAYGLYILATLLGIAVYFVWFLLIPNPPVYN